MITDDVTLVKCGRWFARAAETLEESRTNCRWFTRAAETLECVQTVAAGFPGP